MSLGWQKSEFQLATLVDYRVQHSNLEWAEFSENFYYHPEEDVKIEEIDTESRSDQFIWYVALEGCHTIDVSEIKVRDKSRKSPGGRAAGPN